MVEHLEMEFMRKLEIIVKLQVKCNHARIGP